MRTGRITRRALLGVAAITAAGAADAYGHGTILGSRIQPVYQAGPNGQTPAAWNDSYYT